MTERAGRQSQSLSVNEQEATRQRATKIHTLTTTRDTRANEHANGTATRKRAKKKKE